MKINTNIFSCSIFSLFILTSCSTTTGTVTRGYNTTKDKIWYSMKEVIKKDYGGIKRLEPDPPTVVSGIFMKDHQFGIDKTGYQAYVSLSGFTRPYVVDVEVRVFPEGYETQKYSTDRAKAQEIINKVTQHINDKKYNMSMQEEFAPF
jgi:hypothetical protein